jgi:hypothetical protein
MQVFISHAAPDRDVAARLRADLAAMGRQVTIDGGESSGPRWWDGVLARIERCEAFLFVLSPASLRSPGCMAELRYALQLRRPTLTVRTQSMPVPAELAGTGLYDPAIAGPDRVRLLRAAMLTLPAAQPLPVTLAARPLVPYLDGYRTQLEQPKLDRTSQHEMLGELRRRLREDAERTAVWSLLVRLRARADVAPGVAEELEKLLAPGWRPDPEGRVERRYWDGQAWTTLVRHDGREFNERRVPPPEATWSDGKAAATPGAAPRRDRRLRLVAIAGTAVAGIAAAAYFLVDPEPTNPPITTARVFVDAINVQDNNALAGVTCERDHERTAQLFLAGGFRLTLESVDPDADPPNFTVLATDLGSGGVDRRTYPLVKESGEWRVCSL